MIIKNTPLTQIIRKDELFWIKDIGEMCSESESAYIKSTLIRYVDIII